MASGSNRGALLLFAILLAVIVYGSLFPFEFRTPVPDVGRWTALLRSWNRISGRGDVVANVLFYLPLGFTAVRASRSFVLAVAVGIALTLSMELLQYADAGRDESASDVYANTFGTVLGAAAGKLFDVRLSGFGFQALARQPLAAVLLASWLGYRLYPYVPVIDLSKYWQAVKPVILQPSLSFYDFFRHSVTWLTILALGDALTGRGRDWMLFAAFAGAIMAAQIVMLDQVLSVAEIAGAVAACGIWLALPARGSVRTATIMALLFAFVILWRLMPFEFSAYGRAFSWVPFRSFSGGSIAVNTQSFLEKSFYYGGLIWLVWRCGASLTSSGLWVSLVLLGTSLAEAFLPDRSAEISDALIALIMTFVARFVLHTPDRSSALQGAARGQQRA